MELELGFTKVYQENAKEHKAIREARCVAWQIPRMLADITEEELIPGGLKYGAVGFSCQKGGFLYFMHTAQIEEEIAKCPGDETYVNQLCKMIAFWKKEDCKKVLREKYSERQLLALPTDEWDLEMGITYPLYRMAGGVLDFEKLLRLGLPGLKKEILEKQRDASQDLAQFQLYEGMKISLDTLEQVIQIYIDQAKQKAKQAQKAGKAETQKRMIQVVSALSEILMHRPIHLLEAMELFWMYVLVSEVRDYGRIDTYLSDFYINDIDSGYLSQEEADQMVVKLWESMNKRCTITDGRVIVGGRGRNNEKNADRFAKACIRATIHLKTPDPQLTLRIYQGMEEELLSLAYDAIGQGCTYPILYNDDVVIPDVMRAFALEEEEGKHYTPYGCGEYVIAHRSFGTPSGVINVLKALNGFLFTPTQEEQISDFYVQKEIRNLKKYGIVRKNPEEYDTFEEFYSDFKKMLSFYIEIMAEHEKMEYDLAAERCSLNFHSMLYDDCIERGKGLLDGGIRYLGGTLESYGNVNTADSLYAIKKLVFEDKIVEMKELLDAVCHDFCGYEVIRKKMLLCPKFGNDIKEIDELMVDLHRFICLTAREQAKRVGLHSYLVVVINNSANTSLGALTGASADGRKANQSMANANSPQAGGDKNGITGVFQSMLKVESYIHAGAVQNIKFSKESFLEYANITQKLIQTYFSKGGAQLMITVVGREDLENAIKEPEKYTNLLVRVGGFSARFVDLDTKVQKDILSRTCY